MKQSISNLKLAERGAIISISTYLILSAAKLATGHLPPFIQFGGR